MASDSTLISAYRNQDEIFIEMEEKTEAETSNGLLSPKVGTGSLEITEKRRSELSPDFSMREIKSDLSRVRVGGDHRKHRNFRNRTLKNLPDFLTTA